MKWMFLPFARITDYQGRSPRREYWLFQLLELICAILLAWVLVTMGAIGTASFGSRSAIVATFGSVTVLIAGIAYLLCFLPAKIALIVRRWHDIGNSGWTVIVLLLFGLIPIIGGLAGIVHLVAMCWPGDKGINKYGPNPLESQPA